MRIKTPKQFAVLLAFVISCLSLLIQVIVNLIVATNISRIVYILHFAIVFIIGYFVIHYLLEKLITNKIRTLYRTIHSFKINKGDFPISMNDDVLDKTEKEVLSWVSDKKEEIDKLKDQEEFRKEFIGNLSHELRTPIFSIQGYILTLLEGGLEDESVNRLFLERASKGVDRMTGILEDLDVITKLESERYKINLQVVDLKDLTKEIIDSFEIKATAKKISLSLDIRVPEPTMVICDRDKIGQVLSNLINNAINYGKEGGYVNVRFLDYEENILIEVADDGIGIDANHLNRLFERFYRVDKSRARNEGGTGLGLAIVKHIVEAHEQMINVRSTIGTGSTFSFTLKRSKPL